MAFALVQHKAKSTAAGTNPTITYTSTPVQGNLLVVSITSGELTAGSLTNPAGWTQRATKTNASVAGTVRIIEKIAGASESKTVTFTDANAQDYEIEAYEFSGNNPAGVEFDAAAAGADSVTSVTSIQPGTLTPNFAGELFITAARQHSGNGGTEAIDSGFTIEDDVTFGQSEHGFKIKTDMAAENPTISWNTGRITVAVMAAFRATVSVTLGQATETDTGLTLAGETKTYPALGQATETDSALAINSIAKLVVTAPSGTISSGGPNLSVTYAYTGPAETMHRTLIKNAAETVTYYDSGFVVPGAITINAVTAGIPTDTTGSALHVIVQVQSAITTITSPSVAFDIQWGVVTATFTGPSSPVSTTTTTAAWTFSSTRGFIQQKYRVRLLSYPSLTQVYDSGTVTSAAASLAIPYTLSDASIYRIELTVTNAQGVSN